MMKYGAAETKIMLLKKGIFNLTSLWLFHYILIILTTCCGGDITTTPDTNSQCKSCPYVKIQCLVMHAYDHACHQHYLEGCEVYCAEVQLDYIICKRINGTLQWSIPICDDPTTMSAEQTTPFTSDKTQTPLSSTPFSTSENIYVNVTSWTTTEPNMTSWTTTEPNMTSWTTIEHNMTSWTTTEHNNTSWPTAGPTNLAQILKIVIPSAVILIVVVGIIAVILVVKRMGKAFSFRVNPV